jgi:membrane protease YdiL (CAAX protease family)
MIEQLGLVDARDLSGIMTWHALFASTGRSLTDMDVTPAPASALTAEAAPLTALRWPAGRVVALVAWAAILNVGQAFALRAAHVSALPGQLPYFIRAVVVFAFYGAILAPVVVSARHQGLRFSEAVGLRDAPWPLLAALALVAVFAARLAAYAWALVVAALHLELPGGAIDISRVFGNSLMGVIVTVVVAVLVGPFVEEVVFRGVAFAQLERLQGLAGGVIGSSVLFGLLHVNPLEFVPLVAAGALFAWLFYRTRSLWSAVLAHAVFNLVAVVAIYALRGAL